MNKSAIDTFRELHRSGCFVIPNAWDAGSAVLLHHMGYQALASTSSGFAFTLARPDSVTSLSCEAVLAHLHALVAATPLPVSADFQAGYADSADGVAENVARCVATGVAGLSIEDATGDPSAPLHDRAAAVDRVRAARAAIDAAGSGAVLTARCEAHLVGARDAARTSLDRLVAFADAGADCLFAPGVRDADAIAALVRAVAPKPLNVIVSAPTPDLTVARLAALGVRRISVGSAFARVAWAAFLRSGRHVLETGSFETLAAAAAFPELNDVFRAYPRS